MSAIKYSGAGWLSHCQPNLSPFAVIVVIKFEVILL